MSTIFIVYLQCDICKVEFGKDNPQTRAYIIRNMAAEAGWTANTNLDLCPECRNSKIKKYNYDINTNTNIKRRKALAAAMKRDERDQSTNSK